LITGHQRNPLTWVSIELTIYVFTSGNIITPIEAASAAPTPGRPARLITVKEVAFISRMRTDFTLTFLSKGII